MTRIAFTKVHGTGNDFILIDGRVQRAGWRALAPRLCDRHFGIGADGLLIAEASQQAAVRMQIVNADGSEAEMCGNGLRCFAKWAVERGGLSLANGGVEIETGAGILEAAFPGWTPGAGPIPTGAALDGTAALGARRDPGGGGGSRTDQGVAAGDR